MLAADLPPMDVERELAALRSQVSALRASWREAWADAERSGQVRDLVRDVLADSATRASMAGAAWIVGHEGGASLRSPDGSASIRLNAMTQVRFVYASASGPDDPAVAEQDRWGFENRRTNLGMDGTLFDPTVTWNALLSYQSQSDRFEVRPESLRPLYAWVRKDLGRGLWCTAGLQNVPWDLQSTFYGSSRLMSGDYSIFNYRFGTGKQPGVSLGYRDGTVRGSAAVFSQLSQVSEGWDLDTNLSFGFATRHEVRIGSAWDELGVESSLPGSKPGVIAGLGFCWSGARGTNPQPPASIATPAAAGFTADLRAVLGGASVVGQCALMRDAVGAPELGWWFGTSVQAGAFISETVEAFAEAAWMDGIPVPWIAQAGVNWHAAGPAVKVTAKVIVPFGTGDVNGIREISGGLGMASRDGNASLVTQLQMAY